MASQCGQCSHLNPPSSRVCARCAALLVNLCLACGFENPKGFKFCGNCAAPLTAASSSSNTKAAALKRLQSNIPGELVEKILRGGAQFEGERRNVTILFTDVVGFTSLSEKLDPEQVYTIIEQVQNAFLAEIYAHEGWFDKFLGDGLMAIFGAPVAHEDDPVRAIRVALAMQSALKRIDAELDPALGVTLRVRIGMNAGTAVVAAMGSDMKLNYTPLGDAVNVASRLQTIAEPGTVVVSRAVYEQAKALFDFEDLGSIRVRGRIEPVEIFQVSGPKRTAERVRGIAGVHTEMVGRAGEALALRRSLSLWLRERDRRLVLVMGAAGIGKSRLTAELKRRLLPPGTRVVEGGCAAYGQAAYALFIRLLHELLGISGEEEQPQTRARLIDYVASVVNDPAARAEVLPYVAHLLSIPFQPADQLDPIRYLEPAQLRQQIFLAVRDLLVAAAGRQPLLLICEDLHWIDTPSLDMLLFLLSATEGSPLFFYCTARPELQGKALGQLAQAGRSMPTAQHLRLDLQTLSTTDATVLIEQLLLSAQLPDALKQMILQRAEGNPFYLEEIIRMLIDRTVLRQTEHGWEANADTDFVALHVPLTLQGMIVARVDNLPEETRSALQCAAVIGRSFSHRLLQAVLAGENPMLEDDLQQLCDHELLVMNAQPPDVEYSFRNVLIQETVYAGLLHRRRERLHQRIAESIEQVYAERLDDHLEQLAFHYLESRAHALALPYLMRSAARAAGRYANADALRFYQSAIDVSATTPVTALERVVIYGGMGDVQHVIGSYDASLQSYRNALEIQRNLADAPARQIAELARKIGRVYERKGSYQDSLRWFDTALDELDRDPDSLRAVERMRLYHEMSWVYYRQGELDKAYQWRMRSLEIGAGSDYYAELGAAYNGLVPLFAATGDWDRAHSYAIEGLRMRERIGDTDGTARCYLNLGNIAVSQGDWNKAIDYNRRGLALALRVGQASTIFQIQNNLGYIYMLRGDPVSAREHLTRALQIAERSGDAHQICATLNNFAELSLQEADAPAAVAMLDRSLARAEETRNKSDLAQTCWLFSLARLALGQPATAEAEARRALLTAADAGLQSHEGRAWRALSSALAAQGRYDEALSSLQRSLAIFQRLKDRLELARTNLELSRLYQLRSEPDAAQHHARQAHDAFGALGVDASRQQAAALTRDAVV